MASNIRHRAAVVSNEDQLSQLLAQIVQGLEIRPPPPVEVPLATVAAAAAAVAKGGAVSSDQIADLIQQLARGSISQKDLHYQLVGSPSSSRDVNASPVHTDAIGYVCDVPGDRGAVAVGIISHDTNVPVPSCGLVMFCLRCIRRSRRSLPPSASLEHLEPAHLASPRSRGNTTQPSFASPMSTSAARNFSSSPQLTTFSSPGQALAKSPNIDGRGQSSTSRFTGLHHSSARSTRKKPEYDGFQMSECTFSPKINRVKPHMSTASEYLSERNVVDRLLRGPPGPASPIDAMYVSRSGTCVWLFDFRICNVRKLCWT